MENKNNGVQSPDRLENLIDAMSGKRALVIGDVMLDRFVYGAVNRISPESEAPVLDIKCVRTMPGGAGNVAVNLKALGLQACLLAVTGADEAGRELAGLLDDTADLLSVAGRPTTVKTRFVSAGGQMLRADEESRDDIGDDIEKQILARAEALMAQSDVIILSDYNKGVLTPNLIRDLIALARKEEVPVLADPKKPDYAVYEGAAVITPNRKELAEITGLATRTDTDIEAAAQKLMNDTGLERLVVTRSEDGLSVFVKGERPVHIGNEAQNVTDVSGAGDTAIAGLAAGLAAGASLEEAARLANKAGGLAVAKAGTASISREELRGNLDSAALKAAVPNAHKAFICSGEEAAQTIARWKKQGFQVGFTNGCFDILHAGHVNYLNRARDNCERLVVGLNHDKSVKILKGPERPLHDELSRATVLGALGAVDMVVFFGAERDGEDNTPCALIETIKPDIYFKGGDYTVGQLPEAKIMESLGGRTQIMPLYEGHSTTASMEKMKKTGEKMKKTGAA